MDYGQQDTIVQALFQCSLLYTRNRSAAILKYIYFSLSPRRPTNKFGILL